MAEEEQIPWKRLSAEAVAIVGSILLAFSIDAWWEERQERVEEREVLTALRAELQYNIEQIDLSLEFQRTMLEPTTALLEAAASPDTISRQEFEQYIGQLYWGHTTELAMGVYQGLLQSGQLSLIQETGLRGRIASLMAEYEEMLANESWHGETLDEEFVPFLRDRIDLGKVNNANPTKPIEPGIPYPQIPVLGIETRAETVKDPEFYSIMVLQFGNHHDAITALTRARRALEELITDLDNYLESK